MILVRFDIRNSFETIVAMREEIYSQSSNHGRRRHALLQPDQLDRELGKYIIRTRITGELRTGTTTVSRHQHHSAPEKYNQISKKKKIGGDDEWGHTSYRPRTISLPIGAIDNGDGDGTVSSCNRCRSRPNPRRRRSQTPAPHCVASRHRTDAFGRGWRVRRGAEPGRVAVLVGGLRGRRGVEREGGVVRGRKGRCVRGSFDSCY